MRAARQPLARVVDCMDGPPGAARRVRSGGRRTARRVSGAAVRRSAGWPGRRGARPRPGRGRVTVAADLAGLLRWLAGHRRQRVGGAWVGRAVVDGVQAVPAPARGAAPARASSIGTTPRRLVPRCGGGSGRGRRGLGIAGRGSGRGARRRWRASELTGRGSGRRRRAGRPESTDGVGGRGGGVVVRKRSRRVASDAWRRLLDEQV